MVSVNRFDKLDTIDAIVPNNVLIAIDLIFDFRILPFSSEVISVRAARKQKVRKMKVK